jgi:hypothetical protein
MAAENDYSAPNGVRFKISTSKGFGKWRCVECGHEGFTSHEYGDAAEKQAELHAREHSRICGAGRGTTPQS